MKIAGAQVLDSRYREEEEELFDVFFALVKLCRTKWTLILQLHSEPTARTHFPRPSSWNPRVSGASPPSTADKTSSSNARHVRLIFPETTAQDEPGFPPPSVIPELSPPRKIRHVLLGALPRLEVRRAGGVKARDAFVILRLLKEPELSNCVQMPQNTSFERCALLHPAVSSSAPGCGRCCGTTYVGIIQSRYCTFDAGDEESADHHAPARRWMQNCPYRCNNLLAEYFLLPN